MGLRACLEAARGSAALAAAHAAGMDSWLAWGRLVCVFSAKGGLLQLKCAAQKGTANGSKATQ